MEYEINVAKDSIREVYLTGESPSVLFLGPPGIGKTEGVYQSAREIAESLGKEFVLFDDSRFEEIMANPDDYFVLVEFILTQCEPYDLMGAPRDEGDYLRYKPFTWATVLSKCSGMLFLDEITNVQRPDTMSATLKLLLEKIAGFTKLREDVLVIAAGNTAEQSSLANELPEPVMRGRVMKVNVGIPSVDSWVDYMVSRFGDDWDERVAGYLHLFPDHFYLMKATNGDYVVKTSPRNWTKLSRISHKLEDKALEISSIGLLGEVSETFLAFCKTNVPSLAELESNPFLWNEMKVDSRYFIALKLSQLSPDDFYKYGNIISTMMERDREMLNLLFRLMEKSRRQKIVFSARKNNPELFDTLLESAMLTQAIKAGGDIDIGD